MDILLEHSKAVVGKYIVNGIFVNYKSNDIDYSELVTEPDLALSMRDIVSRYVNGTLDELNFNASYSDDNEIYQCDEPLDALAEASQIKALYSSNERGNTVIAHNKKSTNNELKSNVTDNANLNISEEKTEEPHK